MSWRRSARPGRRLTFLAVALCLALAAGHEEDPALVAAASGRRLSDEAEAEAEAPAEAAEAPAPAEAEEAAGDSGGEAESESGGGGGGGGESEGEAESEGEGEGEAEEGEAEGEGEVSDDELVVVDDGESVAGEDCTAALVSMFEDPMFHFINSITINHCRLHVENKMSEKCDEPRFASVTAEGCEDTNVICTHKRFIELCNKEFGQACHVKRKPFFDGGIENFFVEEMFCVPEACSGKEEAMLKQYHNDFMSSREGWQLDFQSGAEVKCPTAAGTALPWIIGLIMIGIVLLLLIRYLFIAPKYKGGAIGPMG